MTAQLFTPEYAAEQRRIHEEQPAYGSRGFNWAYLAAGIACLESCGTVLDYGCGKGTIRAAFRKSWMGQTFEVKEYDPAVPAKSDAPDPADLVVCVDVMEHVEPELLENVLDHLRGLTKKLILVAVSTIPAKRTMSDGRNTHLIVQPGTWWRSKFEEHGFWVRRVWKTGEPEWVALMERIS